MQHQLVETRLLKNPKIENPGIYTQTNENLDELFKHFDFNNKEVLSVLGSSDQMIASYYYGAKSVDTFDRNLRAAYYTYFRRWLINTTGESYPSYFNNVNLANCIRIAKEAIPKESYEAMAKKFWMTTFGNDFKQYAVFEYLPYCERNLFEKDKDLIKEVLNKRLNFQHIDMFQKQDIDKKYDIIILSNMLEYLEGNEELLINVRNNLERLLRDNGKVICSYICLDHDEDNFKKEVEILTQGSLEYDQHYEYYEPLIGSNREAGYSYTKKRTR